ncbi:uncharacterized protein LOC106674016 [Cimex lectularius]|uniref:Uncharacterized protein n=1 Tax=Cimex lectularius TaxID=79782 RepID=A0A8I6SCM6_CIMLE|nr:uncharacterized protein LOC106674016 [Cimex lectularius]XP_014261930.1 uncharacterized protein LOC106674016 [Cimex lectularius]XP_014261931.1 uncharacterized protein LOC106674016 [Cimex lectularius]XP_014261932.1 uncharacterized protein LOC106674016 [Cimex lectularius]
MVGCSPTRQGNDNKVHDFNCQRLRQYNTGFCSALKLLEGDVRAVYCDSRQCDGKPPYSPAPNIELKQFCLCKTCACNGPATPTPGDYCLVKGCNCCNPCCWCPPKCIYIPPVADGPHEVRTEFFYLKQVPNGTDEEGNQNYYYYEDGGFTYLCRPRNSRGQWLKTCHKAC